MNARDVRRSLVLAAVYALSAEIGRAIALRHQLAATFWPPSGIMLAAVVVYGRRLWPGIALGTFFVWVANGQSPVAALWVACSNVMEALLGQWLLVDVARIQTNLARVRDVVAVVLAVLTITFLGACLTTLGLSSASVLQPTSPTDFLTSWWWAHLSADLVLVPLLLTWSARAVREEGATSPQPSEVIALVIGVLFVDLLLVVHVFPSSVMPAHYPPYYLLPLLVWAGLRFGSRGGSAAVFAVSSMAIVGSAIGRGVFATASELQGFISVASVTTLLFSAMTAEKFAAVRKKSAIQLAAIDAVVSVDADGRLLELNPAAEQMFGRRASDVIGKSAGGLIVPERFRPSFQTMVRDCFQPGGSALVGRRFRTCGVRADGAEFPAEVALALIELGEEKMLTGFIRDRSVDDALDAARRDERQQLEEKVRDRTVELVRTADDLRRGEQLMREAEQLAALGSFQFDLVTNQVMWSEELYMLFGRERETFVPTYEAYLAAIHPDDRERTRLSLEAAIRDVTTFATQERIIRPDGEVRSLQSRGAVYRKGGPDPVRLAGCCQDITEQKRIEDQLRASLLEKDVLIADKDALMRELHHRVKNNLQVITSLLTLQGDRAPNDLVRQSLLESKNRIKSMALVHELFYRSDDFARIDIRVYLDELAKRLLEAYSVGVGRIEVIVAGPSLQLDIERAVPCGLIVNELVANAIHHAFPGDRSGHIWISLQLHGERSLELTVRDDGAGIPPEVDIDAPKMFGLQIIRTLAMQLEGTIEVVRERGTLVRIIFPATTNGPRGRASAGSPDA